MSNNIDKMIELKKMLDDGNITQEEFEKMKKELIEDKSTESKEKKKQQIWVVVLGIILGLLVCFAIGKYIEKARQKEDENNKDAIISELSSDSNNTTDIDFNNPNSIKDEPISESKRPVATMEIENYGTVKIELYPEMAPNTVKNFIALSNNGFYDGLTFHRVVEDFIIQGGDKNGDGTGNATLSAIDADNASTSNEEYNIVGEFSANGFNNNTLSHKRGVISMARMDFSSMGIPEATEKGYNSASSQFFIMTEENTYLDGNYAAFGEVIFGMEVVDKIEQIEVDVENNHRPLNAPIIKSIRVETYDTEYGLPETLQAFDADEYLNELFNMYSY